MIIIFEFLDEKYIRLENFRILLIKGKFNRVFKLYRDEQMAFWPQVMSSKKSKKAAAVFFLFVRISRVLSPYSLLKMMSVPLIKRSLQGFTIFRYWPFFHDDMTILAEKLYQDRLGSFHKMHHAWKIIITATPNLHRLHD